MFCGGLQKISLSTLRIAILVFKTVQPVITREELLLATISVITMPKKEGTLSEDSKRENFTVLVKVYFLFSQLTRPETQL